MVQDAVGAAYRWILAGGSLLLTLLPILVFAGAVVVSAVIALKRLLPEEAANWSAAARGLRVRWAALLVTVLVVSIFVGSLVQARKLISIRHATVRDASASRRNEPSMGEVVQYSPSIALLEEQTYTRRLVVPPQILGRVGVDGVQALAPYLTDPSADNVLRIVDRFRRSGTDVVFERRLTRIAEIPISADSAEIGLKFQGRGGQAGGRYYNVTASAVYRFRNPRNAPAQIRISFPMPQGGGVIQGLRLQTAGQNITDADQTGQYSWTGTVPAGAEQVATVTYTLTGAGGFDYALGSARRRIGQFHMVADSDRAPQFGRAGIFPTSFDQHQAEWRLNDVITFQNISLVFPRVDLQAEILNKTLWWLPAVLVGFSICLSVLRQPRIPLAVAGFGLGLLAVPLLSSYSSPAVATVAGCVLAAIAGIGLLRTWTGALVSIIFGIAGTVFLTIEHGGLSAWALAILVFAAMSWSMLRSGRRESGMRG